MALKYYVYVSKTKVDMLFAQIPRSFLSGLSAELKFNLGVLSTTLKQDADQETTIAKLTATVRYLEQNESIGTIDQPDAYFRGQLSMVRDSYLASDAKDHLVFFGGETDKTIVGLGGFSGNIIGAFRPEYSGGMSDIPSMFGHLVGRMARPTLDTYEETEIEDPEEMLARTIEFAASQLWGPEEEVEFFARRLAFHSSGTHRAHREDMNILLGTPLYVALAK
jgi:hypothetical protein